MINVDPDNDNSTEVHVELSESTRFDDTYVCVSIYKHRGDGEHYLSDYFYMSFEQTAELVNVLADKMIELKPMDQQRAAMVALFGEEAVMAMEQAIHDSASIFVKSIEDRDRGFYLQPGRREGDF